MADTKRTISSTASETFDGILSNIGAQNNGRKTRWIESVRLGLTVLTLLLSLTIIGTVGNSLRVYNKTSVSVDYLLPLWPVQFNLSPTIAILTGACVVAFVNIISLIGSKIAAIRNKAMAHSAVSLLAPTSSLIASVIAIAFYYSINTSSTEDSMQSWSCRWSRVSMSSEPHFGTICRESKTGLYLSIILIPLQVIVVGLAAATVISEKKARGHVTEIRREKGGSPAFS